RPASFEQLDNARQTAGDVFGLGGFAGNLSDDIARFNLLAIANHQIRAHRHLVNLQYPAATANLHPRLLLFIRRLFNHHVRQPGDLIGLFLEGYAFLQVLEFHRATDFSQNSKGEWVPGRQQLILSDVVPVFDQNVRAVNDLITRDFTATLVDDRQGADTIHSDALALAALDRLQIDIFDLAFDPRFVLRRFFQARRTANVERAHRKLRARLADRLRRDYADGLADIDWPARGQVAAIAFYAAAASRFAGQHRSNAHALHA